MEELFMQIFERRDWVAAQMRQQVGSYAQSLAYSLLADGRRPPPWLLPSCAVAGAGELHELNGKPIMPELFFPGSQITTPATNRTVFQQVFPSTFFSKVGIPNEYTCPETHGETVDTSQHEEPHLKQALVNHELAESCAEVNMFSRVQRSRSRQRSIEDRLREMDKAVDSRSSDGMQNRMQRSRLDTMRSNRTTESSSSEPCGDGDNNCQTTSSRLGQKDECNANQEMPTESFQCSKDGGLDTQGANTDSSFPSLVLESQNPNSNHPMISKNCSAGDFLRGSLLDLSNLKIADSAYHSLPETHLWVEPKVLQFDGIESGCLNPTTAFEPAKELQKCASEIALPDLAGRHSLNENQSSTSSSEGLCSVGRLLLEKDALHKAETHSPEGPHSRVSPLLEKDTLQSVQTDFLEDPCSVINLLLEKNTLHTVEGNQRIRRFGSSSGRSMKGSSKVLEKQSSEFYAPSPPCNEPSQLPTRLADTTSESPASSGMLQESLLEENRCGRFSCSQLDGATSQFSQCRSAANPEQFLPQAVNMGDVYGCSLTSSKTQTNVKDSNISLENESSQKQYLLAKLPLQFDGNYAGGDTPLGRSPLGAQKERLKGIPISDSVNRNSGQLSDVQVNISALTEAYNVTVQSNEDEPSAPEVANSISAKRTRMMHSTENKSMTSAGKCTRNLQQDGTVQDICGFDNDVEINENSCTTMNDKQIKSSRPSVRYFLRSSGSNEKINLLQSDSGSVAIDLKSSVAHQVNVHGASSSKRRRMNCQSDGALSRSPSTRSTSSLNCQVGIGSQMLSAENLSGKSQPSCRYFLRSSGARECISLKSEGMNATSGWKRSVAREVHANENSSPKRRNLASLSNVILHNSPERKALSVSRHCGGSSRSGIVGRVSRNSRAHSLQNNIAGVTTTGPLPSCSDVLSDNVEQCTKEGSPFLEDRDRKVTTLAVEHLEVNLQMDDVSLGSVILNPENYSGTNSLTICPSYALDQHCEHASTRNAPIHEKLSYGSSIELDEKCTNDDPKGQLLSVATIPGQKGNDCADCDDTMPELESFSIPVPANSPSIKERAFEALCDSRKLVTLSSKLSTKYKINTLSDVYQSLATRFEKLMNHSPLDADYIKQHNASYDTDISDICGAHGLELDGSFLFNDVVTSSSSNASDGQENSEVPLTPSVEKYSMGKLSGRSGSSSERMGSIPELACFRIEEDSIAEENDNQERLPGFVDRNCSNQWPTGRKALQDVTGLYQNTGKSSSTSTRFMDAGNIDLPTTEAYSTELDRHSNPRNDHAIKKPKENRAPSVKREGKASQSLLDRLSRTEIQGHKNERHKSEAYIEKGNKPSNIVSNVSSFIPLVKQKQQSTRACVKKDVRVKALEAAEAAKRLEEKKQNEREMRKAASKLERERLKQEKELKQKQEVEQKKKRDADNATRKRQREDEKKEKERKRKCIEETRKQQKQEMEKRHPMNDDRDARHKASDDKELRKNLVEGVKSQLKPDERKEPVLRYKTAQSDSVKDVLADERPASFGLQVQENMSNNVEKYLLQSYEMSPYKDSDEEDDDDVELEEESRRRRKLIPSWARKENLDKILLSNQTLDPREIFARKCSFNLSDVLSVHVLKQRFR